MITMTARSNAASVKAYYRGKDLDAPDLPEPYFGGKTLETLGEVCTAQHFNRMVDLKHPLKPRQKLTQRARKPDPTKTKGNPVVGWDVTTSPVKSFSVAVEFSPYRTELLQAYRDANDRVMKDHVEPLAVTRERKGGRMGDTPTENMAWRSHMHTLTRPVKGIPDIQYHIHNFILNVTHDAKERLHKALKFFKVMKNRKALSKAFNSLLRNNLHTLGFATHDTKTGWEITGVPQSLIKKFSSRTKQIDEWKEEKKPRTSKYAHYAALGSRSEKVTSWDYPSLRREWEKRITPFEWEAMGKLKQAPKLLAVRRLVERNRSHVAFIHRVANTIGKERAVAIER